MLFASKRRVKELETELQQARVDSQARLDEAHAESRRLTEQLAAATSQRDALQAEQKVASTTAESCQTEVEELRASVRESQRQLGEDGQANRYWPLLVAEMERRWAGSLGALPGDGGIAAGTPSLQLSDCLHREIQRLREEVGVDVSLAVTAPVEPSDPVVFLLVAVDLLGALVATCEQVAVGLDSSGMALSGSVWAELGDELQASRTRALAAGALVDPIEVGEEQVTVTLHP